jgi:hypothetical protein
VRMNRLEIDLKAFFEREQYAKATAEEKTAHPGSGQKALSRSVEPTGLGAQVMFNPRQWRPPHHPMSPCSSIAFRNAWRILEYLLRILFGMG